VPKSSVKSKPKALNSAVFVVSQGYVGSVGKTAEYLKKPPQTTVKLKLLC